ncbi:hypothetical protein [Methylibium sp.]|uniref:hypothetical protein n=1 Tax=Methylibium sp. TaxID=2067992 RepID=UPI003BAD0EB6
MSVVAAAVIGSAVVGGVASSKAAKGQQQAANRASDTQLAMYDQTREDQTPFREAGTSAIGELGTLLGLETGNPELARFNTLNRKFDFEADPGYQFRMDEGMRGVESSAAARGGALGGRALKELTRYGQGYASNEYGNAFNRYQTSQTNRFNRLASLAGIGQTSANTTGQIGTQVANNVAGNQLYAGDARASGYVGGANAISGATESLGTLYGLGKLGNAQNVTTGSNPYGYNGTMNNQSAYIG